MMQTRHIRVNNFREAILLVKREYGSDAIIGETRRVRRKGIKGFFKPKELEVTIKIPPKNEKPSTEMEDFQRLVKNIGQAIRTDHSNARKDEWMKNLSFLGFEGDFAQKVYSHSQDKDWSKESAAQIVEKMISTKVAPAQKIAFIGPTGAGKTTTLAKIAGTLSIHQGKRVAMVTLDTIRIGAVEQLKIYSRILGLPLAVVNTPTELKQAMDKFAGYDRILVDTSGRSPASLLGIAELRPYLEAAGPDLHRIMVASAITKPSDLQAALKGFSNLRIDSLIFTKLDETSSLGSLAAFSHYSGLPVGYVTAGQNVPADLTQVNEKMLAELVVGIDRNRVLPEYQRGGFFDGTS